MPERTNISEIIEIGSCKLTVDVVSGRAKGVRRTAYLRPLRLCPDGMIGIVLNDRIYPVLLDAKKQFIIHDQGASFAAKNGKVPKIPGVFEVKFGEIPDSYTDEELNVSWSLKSTQFGTLIYLNGSDDYVEQFVMSCSSEMKLNVIDWGEVATDSAFAWFVRLPAGLLTDSIRQSLANQKHILAERVRDNRLKLDNREIKKLTQRLDELNREKAKISTDREDELRGLSRAFNDLNIQYQKLKEAVAIQPKREAESGRVANLKKTESEKIVANVLMNTLPNLAFTPEAPRLVCERFSNSPTMWQTLYELNAGVNLPLTKLNGNAGNAGWRELKKHISSGRDSRGRIYCRRSEKKHQFDVILHWKKDSKDQAKIMNTIAAYEPFDGPSSVLL